MESAVGKAFALLEALSLAKGPSRLTTLAADLGLGKSTAHRVLNELIELGFVEQDATHGLYRPTLRTWELGTAVVADLPIKQASGQALQRLHEQTGETVSLIVRSGDDALYLDKIISPRPMRFTTRVGFRLPLPVTAGGKAILAYATDAPEVTKRTAADPRWRIDDVEGLIAELRTSRERGYSTSTARPGVRSFAAPVIDRDEEAVAALAVSAPSDRLPKEKRSQVIEAVMSTAAHLAESLGRM